MQSSNRAFVSVAFTLLLINPATRVLGQDLGFSPMPMGESINSAKLIRNRVQRVTSDASRLASGIYFSRLQFGGKELVRKPVLMK